MHDPKPASLSLSSALNERCLPSLFPDLPSSSHLRSGRSWLICPAGLRCHGAGLDVLRSSHRGRQRFGSVEMGWGTVDVLLDLQQEEKLSDADMVAVPWEMIFGGTDAAAILLGWIMVRMVLHPDIQSKAQTESPCTTPGSSPSPSTSEPVGFPPRPPELSWLRPVLPNRGPAVFSLATDDFVCGPVVFSPATDDFVGGSTSLLPRPRTAPNL